MNARQRGMRLAMSAPVASRQSPVNPPSTGTRSLGARLALVVLVSLPAFLIVALIVVAVEGKWTPLRRLDGSVSQHMHQVALGHPLWVRAMEVVSAVGSPMVMRVLLGVLVVALWVRRSRRLALWAAATGIGGALIDVVLKAAIGRARPHFTDPVALAPGGSFPSGHTFTATLAAGVALLWALPLISRRGRVPLWIGACAVPLVVGLSRVALGVHWVSDVVGGWLLGAGLVALTSAAFETWRRDQGLRPAHPMTEGVAPEEAHE